ncbi:hypothetical protein SSP35_01_02090 [Streptomyces sp. NBRC 110611]|nr:hypothetical protein SSP35_01_02090 [Streptomyces sp. NBRC 110611]
MRTYGRTKAESSPRSGPACLTGTRGNASIGASPHLAAGGELADRWRPAAGNNRSNSASTGRAIRFRMLTILYSGGHAPGRSPLHNVAGVFHSAIVEIPVLTRELTGLDDAEGISQRLEVYCE